MSATFPQVKLLVCCAPLWPLSQGPDVSFRRHSNLTMLTLPFQIRDLEVLKADLFTAVCRQRWQDSCFNVSYHAYIMYHYLFRCPQFESFWTVLHWDLPFMFSMVLSFVSDVPALFSDFLKIQILKNRPKAVCNFALGFRDGNVGSHWNISTLIRWLAINFINLS